MNIGEVVEQMKNGRFMRRAGWNGKGMHIYIEDGHTQKIPNVKAAGVFRGQERVYAPVVCLFNARGVHQPGWVCSQEDLMATDWEVAE
jgi:hypothetical protein